MQGIGHKIDISVYGVGTFCAAPRANTAGILTSHAHWICWHFAISACPIPHGSKRNAIGGPLCRCPPPRNRYCCVWCSAECVWMQSALLAMQRIAKDFICSDPGQHIPMARAHAGLWIPPATELCVPAHRIVALCVPRHRCCPCRPTLPT